MGYVDPGAFGLISQIVYILLFAIVSAFMFFFNPLKKFVRRLFRRQAAAPESDPSADSAQK